MLNIYSIKAISEEICSDGDNKTALVVIDMQPGFVTRGGNHEEKINKLKTEKIIESQAELIKKAKQNNVPVIFMEYTGDYGDTNAKLKEAAKGNVKTVYFKKNSDGMFAEYNKYRKELIEFVKKNNIGSFIITGANGGACVLSSIEGALSNNCNVIAFSGGIADFNFKDFIFPYVGYYKNIKPKCKNCTFKEVASIEEAQSFMVDYSKIYQKSANNNKSEATQ
jgi:nicotinamidase-related amidase